MRTVFDFIKQFTSKEVVNERDICVINNKYYLAHERLIDVVKQIGKEPFMMGVYLGKSKGNVFFATIPLLRMIKHKTSSRVWVDKATEWLYICGRDVFFQGITKTSGHTEKGGIPLILNQHGEVLGFGRIKRKLTQKINFQEVVIDNILDIGDFLRREKENIFTRRSTRSTHGAEYNALNKSKNEHEDKN